MRIKYVENATVRIVDPLQWDRSNGYIVDVLEPEMALHLLTHPPGDFKIAPDEPLLTLEGITEARAGELVLHDITTMGGLAALSDERIAQIADESRFWGAELGTWRRQAREFCAAAMAAARAEAGPLDGATETSAGGIVPPMIEEQGGQHGMG